MLTTDQTGAIAETAIALAPLELGIGVSKPLVERPYDLIFELETGLVRVQCKWAVRHGDVVTIRCYGGRRNSDGLLRRFYSADEIDAFAAYCAELRRCHFFPIDVFPNRRTLDLRLSPARNNQRIGINWAAHYEFAATLARPHGAIAQLGERQRGTLEVAGSSPAGSTLEGVARTAVRTR